jgi:hypothetical protein
MTRLASFGRSSLFVRSIKVGKESKRLFEMMRAPITKKEYEIEII